MFRGIIAAILLSIAPPVMAQPASATADSCAPSGGLSFLCGVANGEDMVVLPGSQRLIVSSYAAGPHGLYVVDTARKVVQPVRSLPPHLDAGRYGACAGPPRPHELFTHGLSLRKGKAGRLNLMVVNHGAREAIEVFEVSQTGASVDLTWVGCAPMPQGLVANSAVALPDGSILATVQTYPGMTPQDYRQGRNTGAVYLWKVGSPAFIKLGGTELPGNNGIEASGDGRTFYVAATGARAVYAFSLADPGGPLWNVPLGAVTPDNLHLMADGRLLVTSSKLYEASCGGPAGPRPGEPRCPRGYAVAAIDTTRRTVEVIAEGPPNALFMAASASALLGETLWLGTPNGDRLAYRKVP